MMKQATPMDQEYGTLELARVYESQGYYQDALDIYTRLDWQYQASDPDIRASCCRMENILKREKKFSDAAGSQHQVEARLVRYLEDWMTLLVMEAGKKRLERVWRQASRLNAGTAEKRA